jgi:hypothetical protein
MFLLNDKKKTLLNSYPCLNICKMLTPLTLFACSSNYKKKLPLKFLSCKQFFKKSPKRRKIYKKGTLNTFQNPKYLPNPNIFYHLLNNK